MPTRTALGLLLLVQGLLFLALPLFGAPHAWTVLSTFPDEIALDLLGGGESPFDGYDGVAAGPLFWALLELPWLALLGEVGLVHALGGMVLALGATLASFLCARELLGPRAGLIVAALVAFPPPNTWVHQHYGAYHVIPLATVPLGLWILLRSRSLPAWIAGVAITASSATWSLGSVAVAAPVLIAWWWGRLRHGRWIDASLAGALGSALAVAPLLYKMTLHEAYGGLLPKGVEVADATKPLVLSLPAWSEWIPRLARMVTVDLSYGLHFGLHGLGWLGPVLTVAAWACVLIALRTGTGGPWRAAPAGVLLVGLVTGWFVFHPGGAEPFERDARHLLGLTQAFAFLAGAAWVGLKQQGRTEGPVRWVGAALLAAAVLGSIFTQARDLRGSAGFVAATPFRLESRYVSGFFRGPHFRAAPEAAVASCRSEDPMRRADCVRGVAMAFGVGTREPQPLRTLCAPLGEENARWCWLGRGWGEAQLHFRAPDRASVACRELDARGASPEEIRWCLRGVGWGSAQDFSDRPGVMRRWLSEVARESQSEVARGIGLYGSMILIRRSHAEAFCVRSTPARLLAACELGFGDNQGLMRPMR